MPFNVEGSVSAKSKAALAEERSKLEEDTDIAQWLDGTPEQLDRWIDQHVFNDLTAKETIRKLARICAYVMKRVK